MRGAARRPERAYARITHLFLRGTPIRYGVRRAPRSHRFLFIHNLRCFSRTAWCGLAVLLALGLYSADAAAQLPRVSFSSATYTLIEREGGGNVGGFTVRLSEYRDEDTVVGLTFTNETADDEDYHSAYLPTSLTIAAGFISLSYPIQAILDSKDELDETFTIEINSVSNGARKGGPSLTRMTIKDRPPPPPPVAAFATASSSVGEGAGTRNVAVNLAPAPQSGITLSYSVGGTATSGSDYTALSGSVTVAAGSSSVSIPVTIIDDIIEDSGETVILTLQGGGSHYTVGDPASHTLTIENDDPPPPPVTPQANFATANSTASESAGTQNITVNLSPAPQSGITLSYSVGGTATSGGDYTALSGSVTVAAGSSSVNIPVAIIDDSADENSETVELRLTIGSGYTVGGTARHTLTITDNDDPPPPTPAANFATASSSVGEGAGTRNVAVNLAPAPQSGITLSYSVGGTATSGGDYTALSGSVTVAAGSSSVNIPVAIIDDSADENSETVELRLTIGS